MNKLLLTLILATLAAVSQKSQAELDPYLAHNRLGWDAPTVIADGRVRVIITKAKPKLHLPKPQRPVIRLSVEDDDSDYYDELPELQVGYRRPELINQPAQIHDDISDEIKIRLVLARKRALEAYNRTWA